MSSSPSLADLRQRIDSIDDQMHDLIMQRAEMVGQIQAAKPPGLPTVRLAREAQILRRLSARHRGRFPLRTLVQIWQEMIDGFTWLQGSLKIAAPHALEKLVRDQYGVLAAVTWETGSDDLIATVVKGDVALALLPWPGADQDWWLALSRMANRPLIVAGLPFVTDEVHPHALAIGTIPYEPSGDDCSLIVSTRATIAFDGAKEIAQSEGYRLFAVPGHVASSDPKLDSDHILLGGYPTPLRA